MNTYLEHHGILGQKWGIRRFQNVDGTLTSAGKRRYGAEDVDSISSAKGMTRRLNDIDKAMARNKYKSMKLDNQAQRNLRKIRNTEEGPKKERLKEKGREQIAKHEEFDRRRDEGAAEVLRLVDKANQNGYTVNSKITSRNVSSGKRIVALMATTGIFWQRRVSGIKYKVKK